MTGYDRARRLAELGQMGRMALMAAYFYNIATARPPHKQGRPAGCCDELTVRGMSRDGLIAAVLHQETTAADEDGAAVNYVFTCPHEDCWSELEPGDGYSYWCPAEQMEIPAWMVADEAWGYER